MRNRISYFLGLALWILASASVAQEDGPTLQDQYRAERARTEAIENAQGQLATLDAAKRRSEQARRDVGKLFGIDAKLEEARAELEIGEREGGKDKYALRDQIAELERIKKDGRRGLKRQIEKTDRDEKKARKAFFSSWRTAQAAESEYHAILKQRAKADAGKDLEDAVEERRRIERRLLAAREDELSAEDTLDDAEKARKQTARNNPGFSESGIPDSELELGRELQRKRQAVRDLEGELVDQDAKIERLQRPPRIDSAHYATARLASGEPTKKMRKQHLKQIEAEVKNDVDKEKARRRRQPPRGR
jgi:hypothetical protein